MKLFELFENMSNAERQRRLQYHKMYHPDTASEVAVRAFVGRKPIVAFITNDKNETSIFPSMTQADFDELLSQFIDPADLKRVKIIPGNLQVMTPDEVVDEQHISAGTQAFTFSRGFVPWVRNHLHKM